MDSHHSTVGRSNAIGATAGISPPRVGALRDQRQVANELKRLYRSLRRRAGRNPTPQETATLAEVLTRISALVPADALNAANRANRR
jgi:hypothetical protein